MANQKCLRILIASIINISPFVMGSTCLCNEDPSFGIGYESSNDSYLINTTVAPNQNYSFDQNTFQPQSESFGTAAKNFLNEAQKTTDGIDAFRSVSGIDITGGFDLNDPNLIQQVSYQLYDEQGNKRIGYTDPVAGVQALINYVNDQQAATEFNTAATGFLNEARETEAGIDAFKKVSGIDISKGYDLNDQNLAKQISYQLFDEQGNKRIGFTDPVAGVQALIRYVYDPQTAETNYLNEICKTAEGIEAFKAFSGIDISKGYDLNDQKLVQQLSNQLYDEQGKVRVGYVDAVAGVKALIKYENDQKAAAEFKVAATNFLDEARKTTDGIAAFKAVSGIDISKGYDLSNSNLAQLVSYQLYDEQGKKRIGFTNPVAGVRALIAYVKEQKTAAESKATPTSYPSDVAQDKAGNAVYQQAAGNVITNDNNSYNGDDQNIIQQLSYQFYDKKGKKWITLTGPAAEEFRAALKKFLNEIRKTPAAIAALKAVTGIDITNGFDLNDQNLVQQLSHQLYDEQGNKQIGFTDSAAGVQALIKYVKDQNIAPEFKSAAMNFLDELRKTSAGISAFKSVSGIDITSGYDLTDKDLIQQIAYQLYDENGNKRIGFTDPAAGAQALIKYVKDQNAATEFKTAATNLLNEIRKTPAGIAAFKSVSGIDISNGFDLNDQNLVKQVSYQLYDEQGNKRIGFTNPAGGVQALIKYVNDQNAAAEFKIAATNLLNEMRKTTAGIAAFRSVSGIDIKNGFDLNDQNLIQQVSYQLYDEQGNKRIGFTDPAAGVQALIAYVNNGY